jgi:hypothetical protein
MNCGASAESGFHIGCVVIHTGTAQLVEAFHIEESVGDPRSDDHRLAEHIITLDGSHAVESIAASLQVGDRAGDMEIRAEFQCLKIDKMRRSRPVIPSGNPA